MFCFFSFIPCFFFLFITNPFSLSDPHGHGIGGVAAHGPEGLVSTKIIEKEKDIESGDGSLNGQDHATRHAMGTGEDHVHGPMGVVDSALTKIVGVAILEFGILLHR